MVKCKLDVTEHEINEMFAEIDEDGSGTIEQDEFLNIISRKNITPNLEKETREVFKVSYFNFGKIAKIKRFLIEITMELSVGQN